jgi:hypothetical protein
MRTAVFALLAVVLAGVGVGAWLMRAPSELPSDHGVPNPTPDVLHKYKRRLPLDTAGFRAIYDPRQPAYSAAMSFEEIHAAHVQHVTGFLALSDEHLATQPDPTGKVHFAKAGLLHSQGKPREAYEVLKELEAEIRGTPREDDLLYSVVYYMGVSALRIGENENCIMCRGESSCIFPISPAAVHTNPAGSRMAIAHFSDYLGQFPDDYEVKWMLNLAHMTLGEYPEKVDPRHRISLENFMKPTPHAIGAFRDVSHRVGVERFNQSGGSILEDFDNDGLLDLVVTDWSTNGPLAYYRNKGDGTFEDRTKAAGLTGQFGGLTCFQTDYNNDGHMDIFVPRGAWMPPHLTIRPSLLKNNGNGTFTDVTVQAGLATPLNSNSASWGDFDNDGHLDLFMCGMFRPCKLYRNKGDGTFEDVAAKAGLPVELDSVLGAAWIDYDNDGYPDLFANVGAPPLALYGEARGLPRLFHNNRNGTFTDVTKEMGIDGPKGGFSCWAWDFDNDGWIDIYATSAIHSLEDVVKGIEGQPHELPTPILYKNMQGKGFKNITKEVGLDLLCAPMGSNFADLDNDGYLDFYLATGNPDLSTLVPNRLFRNLGGKRFHEITAPSRTGHLQKGHSVSFGDWNRDGALDLFVQLGGAVPGDQYHNVLFQNPGQSNNWLSVKLVGQKTNRAAYGARIRATLPGENPLTVHRHVSSGSSFGANPLEQHIGLGKADRVARLEVYWPVSGTTQVFENIPANRGIVITEFAKEYQTRTWKPIPVPE